jgi:hypothetical protein
MNTVPPNLLALLRESIGKTMNVELAARICAASASAGEYRGVDSADYPPQECQGVVFHVERMADVHDEVAPLIRMNWEETERYRWVVGLEVDYDQYVAAEKRGRFVLFTCREHGEMVGYVMMDIYRNRHTSRTHASEDALYLHPKARRGMRGVFFVRYVLRSLASMGVVQAAFMSKVCADIGAVYRRVGGERVADMYVMNTGGES